MSAIDPLRTFDFLGTLALKRDGELAMALTMVVIASLFSVALGEAKATEPISTARVSTCRSANAKDRETVRVSSRLPKSIVVGGEGYRRLEGRPLANFIADKILSDPEPNKVDHPVAEFFHADGTYVWTGGRDQESGRYLISCDLLITHTAHRGRQRAIYVSQLGSALSAEFGPDDELWLGKEAVASIGH